MSESEQESIYIVSPTSTYLGTGCYVCGEPFEIADATVQRYIPPAPGEPGAGSAVAVHYRCAHPDH